MPTTTLYDTIYERQKAGDPIWKGYGHSNHGVHLVPWLVNWCGMRLLDTGTVTVIDLGCGHNELVRDLAVAGIAGIGIDSACPGADAIADILDQAALHAAVHDALAKKGLAPWRRRSSLVCSFDCLEHLAEDDLDKAFGAMKILAPSFCFSIGYGKSTMDLDGENLHATARDEAWWTAKLRDTADIIDLPSGYILGRWKD